MDIGDPEQKCKLFHNFNFTQLLQKAVTANLIQQFPAPFPGSCRAMFRDATCFASPAFPDSSFYSQTLLITGKHGNDVVVRNAAPLFSTTFALRQASWYPLLPDGIIIPIAKGFWMPALFAGNGNIKHDALERLQFFLHAFIGNSKNSAPPYCVCRAWFWAPKVSHWQRWKERQIFH